VEINNSGEYDVTCRAGQVRIRSGYRSIAESEESIMRAVSRYSAICYT